MKKVISAITVGSAKAYDWLEDRYYSIRRFLRRFKRIAQYLPLIWKDEDFDHAYILKMLQYKIRRTREHIGTCQRHTEWRRDVKAMKQAERLIQDHLDSRAAEKLDRAYNKIWGKLTWDMKPNEDGSSSTMTFGRTKTKTPAEKKKEHAAFSIHCKERFAAEEREWNQIWDHLAKHMRSWWD